MIEVVTFAAGVVRDRAEAPDPESAVVAARALLLDARDAGCSGVTAAFYVAGRCVRSAVGAVALGGLS
jgi:hypothetical protein